MTMPDPTSLVDIHNHLVPGVDDGANDVPAVLDSVQRMTRLGIRRFVATPHLRGSLTLEPTRLEQRLSEVTEAWKIARDAIGERFSEVEFRRGHEVLLDLPEPDLTDPRIRLAGSSFVLVEWPRLRIPPGTPPVLRRISAQGYRPIVAHPERYAGMGEQLELASKWRDAGALLQVNFGSLDGRYGRDARIVALRLLEDGLVDYLASDFHGQSRLNIYKEEAYAVLEERGAADALDLLCRINPARILDDLDPVIVPPVPPSSKLFDRIRGIVRRQVRTSEPRRR